MSFFSFLDDLLVARPTTPIFAVNAMGMVVIRSLIPITSTTTIT